MTSRFPKQKGRRMGAPFVQSLLQNDFFRSEILFHNQEGGPFEGDGCGARFGRKGIFPRDGLPRREVGGHEIDYGFGARLAPFGVNPAYGALDGLLPEGDGPLGVAVHEHKGDNTLRRILRVQLGGAAVLVQQCPLRIHLAVGLRR